jgi:hypothetical protein
MNTNKSPFGGILDSQSDVTKAEAKCDDLALRCENLTNKTVRPPYRCITCQKLAREHKNNDIKHCKGTKPSDPDHYLQVLNDQNRKTVKWLANQLNMEKCQPIESNQRSQCSVDLKKKLDKWTI